MTKDGRREVGTVTPSEQVHGLVVRVCREHVLRYPLIGSDGCSMRVAVLTIDAGANQHSIGADAK